jgi:regulator of protease activity HflC (stomatin/prohibitin superfamily)
MFESNQEGGFNFKIPRVFLIVFFSFMFLLISGGKMFYTVGPGEKGVIFERFGDGLVKEKVFGQGFHIIAPWNDFYIYNVKIQEDYEEMEVLSKNGLSIKLDLSFRYTPEMTQVGYLHDLVGKDYLESIIRPEIRSVTREVIGEYLPEELYSTKRVEVEEKIFEITSKAVASKYILLDAILIRDVTLPKTLQVAIENKLKFEQEALEYEFKLLKEEKEKERKKIEAEGISEFQRIVNKTITPQLLRWKGVETTQELAKSPNSKVIVIGNGENGLPIILGGDN